MTTRMIYVVEVFDRKDGFYAFESRDDAERFADTVEYEATVYGSASYLHKLPLVDSATTDELIEAERSEA